MLISVPLTIKYVGPVAPLLAKLDLTFFRILAHFGLQSTDQAQYMPVHISGIKDWAVALKALAQHKSQLAWFRWLYMAFSRYLWVNEWLEIPVGMDNRKV